MYWTTLIVACILKCATRDCRRRFDKCTKTQKINNNFKLTFSEWWNQSQNRTYPPDSAHITRFLFQTASTKSFRKAPPATEICICGARYSTLDAQRPASRRKLPSHSLKASGSAARRAAGQRCSGTVTRQRSSAVCANGASKYDNDAPHVIVTRCRRAALCISAARSRRANHSSRAK